MADRSDISWAPLSPWTGLLADIGPSPAGVTVAPRQGLCLVSVGIPPGREVGVAGMVLERFGLALPRTPRVSRSDGIGIVWAGPGQWLVVAQNARRCAALRASLGGLAAIADQSDGRALLRIGGPRARDALAKGCTIDLHDCAFAPGDVALTSIAHVPVHLWRCDDGATPRAPLFDAAVPRSMAGSFWSWLSASAAEFGCKALPP